MKAKKVLTPVCMCVALMVGLTSMLLAYPSGPPKSISEPAIDPQCPGGKPPPCATPRSRRTPRRPRQPAPSTGSGLPGAANGSYDDVSTGFSLTTNPNAVWSYGYLSAGNVPDTKTFRALEYGGWHYDFFGNQGRVVGLFTWRIALKPGTPSGHDTGLCVYKNVTQAPLSLSPKATSSAPTATLEPNQVSLHPGFGGVFCVIRWRAPKAGSYTLTGDFKGLDEKPTTSDVYIYKNGEKLWWDFVNDYQRPHQFSTKVSVKKGDSIDFIVGYGQDKQIYNDTTGLDARIYPSN